MEIALATGILIVLIYSGAWEVALAGAVAAAVAYCEPYQVVGGACRSKLCEYLEQYRDKFRGSDKSTFSEDLCRST